MSRKQVPFIRVILLILLLSGAADAAGWRGLVPYPVKACYRTARSLAWALRDKVDQWTGQEHPQYLSQVQRLGEMPVRPLDNDPLVREFLSHHPVYVSLTTSPTRIDKLRYVLSTLDHTLITKIILAIPQKYGRDNSEYEIPEYLTTDPHIEILRPEVDLGPATKMVPAIEWARNKDKNSVVVSIDDDYGYPIGMITELITAWVHARERLGREVVISGAGQDFRYWGINVKPYETQPLRLFPDLMLKPVDVVEGFGAIIYPVSVVNTEAIARYALQSKFCMTSDDLVISWVLGKSGIPRYRLDDNPFHDCHKQAQFAYGRRSDALHRGGGLGFSLLKSTLIRDANHMKYRQAFRDLEGAPFETIPQLLPAGF